MVIKMVEDEYEIMPHKAVEKLKKQIDNMKKAGLTDPAQVKELQGSIQQLNSNMANMIQIFHAASEQMKGEEEALSAPEIKMINTKLDALVDQNKKIARALVAISDMIKGPQPAKPPMTKPLPPKPTTHKTGFPPPTVIPSFNSPPTPPLPGGKRKPAPSIPKPNEPLDLPDFDFDLTKPKKACLDSSKNDYKN